MSQTNHPLPPGFMLETYRIERQLAHGGFSIVYLAHDAAENPVAIKEYLPNSLALRSADCINPEISPENQAAFNHGLRCFFEEGRAVAKLDHPYLVKVTDFLRANGTVYLVMRYERGRTLLEHIHRRKGHLEEPFLRDLFGRVLDALDEVHSNGLLHLDIKPANIYLRADGTPVLLDFGAARQALQGEGPYLKGMYTPGYAAPEQYRGRKGLGPFTDFYALGACMYASLSGSPPPPSDERSESDTLELATRRWRGSYSSNFLSIIDYCLQLDPSLRPDNAGILLEALTEGKSVPGASHGLMGKLRRMFS
ncbi:MAG: serine/threonine protein kinase [Rhodocyclaceae bacterium]|jgi:serine/threonine protein kinase|nr:serine/threonine protein kinase [Rhodocyclaceae bacterium]